MAHKARRHAREEVAASRAAAESRNLLREHGSVLRPRSDADGPQCVTSDGRLFISAVGASADLLTLRELGVTHIVCAGRELQCHFPEHIEYVHVKLDDRTHAALNLCLPTVLDFMDRAFASDAGASAAKVGPGAGGASGAVGAEEGRAQESRVLVHCMGGRSRSATIVCAFLMRTQRLTAKEALKRLQKVREVVNPNAGFLRQLELWEKHDFALERPPPSTFLREHVEFVSRTGRSVAGAEENDLRARDHACAACGTFLFAPEDVVHGADTQDEEREQNGRGEGFCSRVFLRYPVSFVKDEDCAGESGAILCPGKDCEVALGEYAWQGRKCGCGEWVSLAFCLNRNNIAPVLEEPGDSDARD